MGKSDSKKREFAGLAEPAFLWAHSRQSLVVKSTSAKRSDIMISAAGPATLTKQWQ